MTYSTLIMNIIVWVCVVVLFLAFVQGDDLQEALLNRRLRARSLLHSKQSYQVSLSNLLPGSDASPSKGCLIDSDCKVRLGTRVSFTPSGYSSYTYNYNKCQAGTGPCFYGRYNNLMGYGNIADFDSRDFSCHYYSGLPYQQNKDNSDANPYISNSLSGVECDSYINHDFEVTPAAPDPVLNENFASFYETIVNYPDMKCIEGKCIRWAANLPGFGKDYCHPDFRYTSQGGNCPAKTQCNYIKPDQSLLYNVVSEFAADGKDWKLYANSQTGSSPFFYINNGQAAGFYQSALQYSLDPRDSVGTCGCVTNSDCGVTGMICSQGFCYCTASSQCVNHNGATPQQCLTNRQVIQQANLDSSVYPTSQVVGSCGCVVGSESSCNFNGICQSMQSVFPSTYFPSFYKIEDYTLSTYSSIPSTTPGRCQCYGQAYKAVVLTGGIGTFTQWNDTVVGSACEYDVYRDTKCSGHGRPICTGAGYSSDRSVYSKNGGSFLGFYCTADTFNQRGGTNDYLASCQCDAGWTPDTSTNPKVLPCSIPLACSSSVNQVQVNGVCRCTGDGYYNNQDSGTTTNPCINNCASVKSNNRGTCFYNPNYLDFQPQSEVAAYNNDVYCTTGWATRYDVFGVQLRISKYWTGSLALSLSQISAYLRLNSFNSDRLFCVVPYNEVLGIACGEGGNWDPLYQQCIFCTQYDNYIDNNGKAVVTFTTNHAIPYCARTCLAMSSNLADLTTGDYNDQICGGVKRGQCVPDNRGGEKCQCNPGYTGVVCQTPICPRANGAMCSGIGLCDSNTATCVCPVGFQGVACESRATDCGQSQVVKSYPLPDNTLKDL